MATSRRAEMVNITTTTTTTADNDENEDLDNNNIATISSNNASSTSSSLTDATSSNSSSRIQRHSRIQQLHHRYLLPPPREEVFIGYSGYDNHWYGPAIRYKNYKLIQGKTGGPESADNIPDGSIDRPMPGGLANVTYLLYDVVQDPSETNDISMIQPAIVQLLRKKLQYYQLGYVPPIPNNPKCPFPGHLVNTTKLGPTWLPWCNKSIEYKMKPTTNEAPKTKTKKQQQQSRQ